MGEKQFTLNLMKKPSEIEMDGKMISKYDVVRLLNEQQATINKLRKKLERYEPEYSDEFLETVASINKISVEELKEMIHNERTR